MPDNTTLTTVGTPNEQASKSPLLRRCQRRTRRHRPPWRRDRTHTQPSSGRAGAAGIATGPCRTRDGARTTIAGANSRTAGWSSPAGRDLNPRRPGIVKRIAAARTARRLTAGRRFASIPGFLEAYDYIASRDAQDALYQLVEMAHERGITVRDGSHGEVLTITFAPHGTAHPAVMVCKLWLTLYRGPKPDPKRIWSVDDIPPQLFSCRPHEVPRSCPAGRSRSRAGRPGRGSYSRSAPIAVIEN